MTAAHTPGPWTFGEMSEQVQGPRGQFVADTMSEAETDAQMAEARANARLIAAAPALAEALRGMLSDWQDQFGDGACDCRIEPENDGHVCNCCLARAALKQAGVEP